MNTQIQPSDNQIIRNSIQNQIDILKFNQDFGNLMNFYKDLVKKKFYLPQFNRQVINIKYLLKVANQEVFCPKSDEIQPGGAKEKQSHKKIEIFKEINSALQSKQIKETGFNYQALPSKQYLLDVLWVVDQQNYVFFEKKEHFQQKININFPVRILEGVDLRVCPVKKEYSLVRLTKQQKEELQKQKIQKMLMKKLNRLDELEEQKQKLKRKGELMDQQFSL